jgi:Skp family chaperone for outer membrane proteins
MSLTNLSSASLERLVELITEKEKIQTKLAKIQRAIEALETGVQSKQNRVTAGPKKRATRRGKRLKDRLLKALEAAGKAGLSVQDLAANLKAKPTSVSVWFYTTGKQIKGIKKIGPGRYAYSSQ